MLILFNVQDRFPRTYPGEKSFGIELVFGRLPHRSLLCSDERARLKLYQSQRGNEAAT
jgi:hypothetical protein